MNFAVVIPTYKRTDALRGTIESILASTTLPTELIIIDDDQTSSEILEHFTEQCTTVGITFLYHQKDHAKVRRGLSESKNLAVTLTTAEIVYFLDDDVILDPKYFTELQKVWTTRSGEEKLAGVGGRISNNRPTTTIEKLYKKCFGLTGQYAWDVNDVGYQIWDESVTIAQKAQYMHGGVSSYRRTILQQFPFAVFSGGRTGLEDVDHCLRLKQAGYYLYYVPNAHLTHHPAPAGREAAYVAGHKEGKNRREIYRKYGNKTLFGRMHFVWSTIGWIGKKLLSRNFRAAKGLIVGSFS